MPDLITLAEVEDAWARRGPEVRRTPIVPLAREAGEVGRRVSSSSSKTSR